MKKEESITSTSTAALSTSRMGEGEYVDAVWHRWWMRFAAQLGREGWVPGGCQGSQDLLRVSERDLERVVRYVDMFVMRCPDVEEAVRRIVADRRAAAVEKAEWYRPGAGEVDSSELIVGSAGEEEAITSTSTAALSTSRIEEVGVEG